MTSIHMYLAAERTSMGTNHAQIKITDNRKIHLIFRAMENYILLLAFISKMFVFE